MSGIESADSSWYFLFDYSNEFGGSARGDFQRSAVIENGCGIFGNMLQCLLEAISTTGHFAALYEEYHIDFEQMYYDLAKLLDSPLSKGSNTNEQNEVLKKVYPKLCPDNLDIRFLSLYREEESQELKWETEGDRK